MPDPGFVTVFHAETGNYAEQPQSALPALYRAGWALVTDTPPAEPEPEARHISRADADDTRARVLSGAPPAELNAQGEVPRTEATPGDGSERVPQGAGADVAPAAQPPAAAATDETPGTTVRRVRAQASNTEE